MTSTSGGLTGVMTGVDERQETDEVRVWRFEELRRLGFKPEQRRRLVAMMERGELDLQQVRHLTDDLGCPVEEAWWILV
jgi:hypothetical protein